MNDLILCNVMLLVDHHVLQHRILSIVHCDLCIQISTSPCFTQSFFPFLQTKELPKLEGINDAYVLLNLGDSVTTDHISPAGSIARNSPAARYLAAKGWVLKGKTYCNSA